MLISAVIFKDSWVLYLIPLIWIMGALLWWWQNKIARAALLVPAVATFTAFKNNFKSILLKYFPLFKLLPLTFLLIALARPQAIDERQQPEQGIDIVLAMDVSASMLAKDFKPSRLDEAKKVALNFVENRPHDRVGIVVFSGESFTLSPLTTDHRMVKKQINEIREGILIDGTAIGMGLATATDRLRESDAKSKVVILLTDGENNYGAVDPKTATDIAKEYQVRVYTVGVGSNGVAATPTGVLNGEYIYENIPVKIDEVLLKDIAVKTGGKYYRAANSNILQAVFDEIDKLEKSKIKSVEYNNKSEKFHSWLLIAVLLLLIEIILNYTWLKTTT